MTSYIIRTRVAKVEKKEELAGVSKVGEVWTHDIRQLGWFVLLDRSREWIFLGDEQPDLVVGQEVTIRIEGK